MGSLRRGTGSKQATCKTCEQRTFDVTFSLDDQCQNPLPFASGRLCGHPFSTHAGKQQHENSATCFGQNSSQLQQLNIFLTKCKQAVIVFEQQSKRGEGEVRPHQGLKRRLTDSSDTGVVGEPKQKYQWWVTPEFRQNSTEYLNLVSDILIHKNAQLRNFESFEDWRMFLVMVIKDLSAAGRIGTDRKLQDAPDRRKTLYSQVVEKLETQGSNWLGKQHLRDSTAIELFKQLAEDLTNVGALVEQHGLKQIALEIVQVDQEKRLERCEVAISELKLEDKLQIAALQSNFAKYFETVDARFEELDKGVAKLDKGVASLGATQRQQAVATEVLKEMLHELEGKYRKLQGEVASLQAERNASSKARSSFTHAALGAPTPAAQEDDQLEEVVIASPAPADAADAKGLAPEASGAPTPSSPKSPTASGARTPRASAPGIVRRVMRRVMQRGRQTPAPTPRTPGAVAPDAAALVTPVRSSPRFRSLAHFLRSPPSTFRFMRS